MTKMPMFKNENEFNQYFKRDREICEKHRVNGEMVFEDKQDFVDFLSELFMGQNITFDVREVK